MREEVFQYHSVSLAEVAFLACLIDRSSISPSLESTTCDRFAEMIIAHADDDGSVDFNLVWIQ